MASKLTNAEILAQIPAARERGEGRRQAGLLAKSATYDRTSRRFLLELTNGALLGVPVASLPALHNATPKELSEVELTPAGGGLHFGALDVDISVPGIVLATIGKQIVARAFAGAGGSAKSHAKSAAARANGAKGGRPRKQLKIVRGKPANTSSESPPPTKRRTSGTAARA